VSGIHGQFALRHELRVKRALCLSDALDAGRRGSVANKTAQFICHIKLTRLISEISYIKNCAADINANNRNQYSKVQK